MKALKLSSASLWVILMVVFYFPHIASAGTCWDFNSFGPFNSNILCTTAVESSQTFIGALGIQGIGVTGLYKIDPASSLGGNGSNANTIQINSSPTLSGNSTPSGGTDGANRYFFSALPGLVPDGDYVFIDANTSAYWMMRVENGSTTVLGDNYFTNIVDNSTRIISVTPAASSTIATSTGATFGAIVNINDSDYQSGMYVQIKYAHQAEGTLIVNACIDCLFTTINFPITHSGSSSFSTTSPAVAVGRYVMTTTIRNASFIDNTLQFLGFGQFATLGVKTATSTTFIASAPNAFDILTDNLVSSVNAYLASSTVSMASCTNFTQFALLDCMNLLFVPQWGPIKQAVDNFRQGFLTYWPWGYITRFAVIMSGSATSTLPAFTVGFQNVLPPGGPTDNYTLDMNDMLAGGAAALDNVHARGGTANEKDILEPILRTFLALLIVIMIVRDLTKIGVPTHHSSAAARGQV